MSAQMLPTSLLSMLSAHLLMDVMNNLETSAVVGEEMSYFRRAETSNASSRVERLSVALSKRLHCIPLIELAENVSPRRNIVDSSSV